MKKRTLLLIIATATLMICCTRAKAPDYLILNGQQLKSLGITLTDQGLFYKNYNPNWQADNENYPYLGFLSNETYLTTRHYGETDTLTSENKYDSAFLKMDATKNDFYPLLIGNTKGQMSLDKYTALNKEIKLVPVAICMAETKIANRQDTMVVWFKPTESLKNALPGDINMDDFLRVPVISK